MTWNAYQRLTDKYNLTFCDGKYWDLNTVHGRKSTRGSGPLHYSYVQVIVPLGYTDQGYSVSFFCLEKEGKFDVQYHTAEHIVA
jgi:hypothetical protein